MDIYEMSQEQFTKVLAEKTTPQAVYEKAGEIYEYLTLVIGQGCEDSVLREWSFEWACAELGIGYNDIYDRWLWTD